MRAVLLIDTKRGAPEAYPRTPQAGKQCEVWVTGLDLLPAQRAGDRRGTSQLLLSLQAPFGPRVLRPQRLPGWCPPGPGQGGAGAGGEGAGVGATGTLVSSPDAQTGAPGEFPSKEQPPAVPKAPEKQTLGPGVLSVPAAQRPVGITRRLESSVLFGLR